MLEEMGLPPWLVAFILDRVSMLLFLVVVLLAFPLIDRWARRIARARLGNTRHGRDYEYTISTLLRYTKYFIVSLIILSIFGLSGVVSTALASVGFTALALGLAAQTVASNMIAGLFLLLDNQISVGDRVKIGDVEGSIQDIRLRTTQILLDNGTLAIVPNKKLVDDIVLNRSAQKAKAAPPAAPPLEDKQALVKATK